MAKKMEAPAWLLALALQLQVADGFLTYYGVSGGYGTEGNPLVAALISAWGWYGLVLAKAWSCGILFGIAWHFPARIANVVLGVTSIFVLLVAVLPWTIAITAGPATG